MTPDPAPTADPVDAPSGPERKALSTLAVATLTTGIVMVHGFAGVGEAAEWIMGHPVWTHELPDVQPRIVELVLAQRPDFPIEVGSDLRSTINAILTVHGDTIELARGAERRAADPLSTLRAKLS